MATAAAIDRLVHHSVILEFDVPSFRAEEAEGRGKKKAGQPAHGDDVTPRLWTVPDPWTRRRAHRSLENRARFPTPPTARHPR